MKTKNKNGKIFAITALIIFFIVLLLVSCSKKDDKPAGNTEPTPMVNTPTATAPAATNTPTPEVATGPDADISNAPEPTKTPDATDFPEITEEPTLTDSPDATVEPSLTATPEPGITEIPDATPTPEPTKKPGVTNTPTPVITKAPTKIPTKKPTTTSVPTKAATKTSTPVPTKVATNTPTPTPTCPHTNTEAIEVYTVIPEEGHWETKAAWDEPVYVYCEVCMCGVTELDYTEDGRTTTDDSYYQFSLHTLREMHSYGSTYVLVDTIHHPAEQVWIVDKQSSTVYEYLGWKCTDCGFEHLTDNCRPGSCDLHW